MLLSASLFCGNLTANNGELAGASAPTDSKPRADAASKAIHWSHLAPENGKPFIDPFAKLSSDQIADLSYVGRVRRMIAEEKIDANGEDAKRAAKLSGELNDDGIDIAWLMAQRRRVQQMRGLQIESMSQSIAKSLGDQRVTVTGYVIPIKAYQGRLTEFFLVPTVAACSHEAAPPRLQVVFVTTEEGIATPEKAMPVRVTGIVTAQTTTRMTINGGGKSVIRSAYAMLSSTVETYVAR